MIRFIRDLIEDLSQESAATAPLTGEEMRQVSAALLTEVMASDGDCGEEEQELLRRILTDELHYPSEEASLYLENARNRVDSATSLFEFTDVVNRRFTNDEKFQLMIQMWRIARADGEIDKHEEATIRKVAELIYVPHSAFIRAKQISRTGE